MPVKVASNAEVAHCGPTPVQAVADLFALQRLHQDILFCKYDYIACERVKAINRMFQQLCSELPGVCCPLVDAFAIPDLFLRAPIGTCNRALCSLASFQWLGVAQAAIVLCIPMKKCR